MSSVGITLSLEDPGRRGRLLCCVAATLNSGPGCDCRAEHGSHSSAQPHVRAAYLTNFSGMASAIAS